GRQLADLPETELGVPGGGLAAGPVPALEARQEQPERGRLQLVQPGVVADELEVDLVARAVEAEQPNARGELLVGKKLKVERTSVGAIPGAPKAWAASSI